MLVSLFGAPIFIATNKVSTRNEAAYEINMSLHSNRDNILSYHDTWKKESVTKISVL